MASQQQEDMPTDPGSSSTPDRPNFDDLYEQFNRLRPRSPLARATSPERTHASRSSRPHSPANHHADLQALEYVSDFDPHLMCPICHVPFISPIMLDCDHIFCEECFVQYARDQTRTTRCPSCRTPLDEPLRNIGRKRVPRLITNMIDDIQVKCPHNKYGCSAVLARGDVQRHRNYQCEYRPVDCPDETCDLTIPLKFALEKKEEGSIEETETRSLCKHQTKACEGCAEILPEWEMRAHIFQDCKIPTRCTECDTSEKNDDGSLNHTETCSKGQVDCSARSYGCTVRTTATTVLEHEQRCIFTALMPTLESQSNRLEILQTQLLREKARNETLEDSVHRLQDILTVQLAPVFESLSSPSDNDAQSAYATSRALIPASTTITPILSMNPPAPHSDLNSDHVQTLRADFSNLSTHVTSLTDSLAALDARQSMALMNETLRIKEELAHLNAAMFTVRGQVGWLLNHQRNLATGGTGANASGVSAGSAPVLNAAAGAGAISGSVSTSGVAANAGPAGSRDGVRAVGARRSSSGGRSQERVKL